MEEHHSDNKITNHLMEAYTKATIQKDQSYSVGLTLLGILSAWGLFFCVFVGLASLAEICISKWEAKQALKNKYRHLYDYDSQESKLTNSEEV